MQHFDVIVIGAGSGLEVSSAAADRGLSVAVVERGPFGGTCLNRGCIPSKMLIHSADVMETIAGAHRFGIHVQPPEVDWQAIVARVAQEVDRDAAAVEQGNRESEHIEVFDGDARFVDHKTLEVAGRRIRGETVVIAAGTRPSVPDIPGINEVPYLTSDNAMRLERQPRSLAVVGGGYVAAELAHFFGALGTEVTIVHRGDRLLRHHDDDVAQRFTEVYGRRFQLLLESSVASLESFDGVVRLNLETPDGARPLDVEAVLFATGRIPNTDQLAVGRTGVEVDERGFVQTDEYLETSVPGIWALGDIVGRYLLKHSANLEAGHVAHNIFEPDHKVAVDYHAMPAAVFASPQVASVGVTEREARAQGLDYVVGVYPYDRAAYGASIEDHDGFVKAIADRESGELLGCHIVGTQASVLIQEAAIVMRARASAHVIEHAIYVHPALPEVFQRAVASMAPPARE